MSHLHRHEAHGRALKGLFARALLTALRENAEVLEGHQLFTAIRQPVMVNAYPTPDYGDIHRAGHDNGDFLFVPVRLPAMAHAPAAQDSGGLSVDMQVWDRIEDSTDPTDFEIFIESFPLSLMVPFARNKLNGLTGVPTALVVPPKGDSPSEPLVFKDCDVCPEMMAISSGGFMMGGPGAQAESRTGESPRHWVNHPAPLCLGQIRGNDRRVGRLCRGRRVPESSVPERQLLAPRNVRELVARPNVRNVAVGEDRSRIPVAE